MNDVAGVLHDQAGEAEITRIWTEATGRTGVFEEEVIPARRQILRESLSSELYATSVALHRIARPRPGHARLHADSHRPHTDGVACAFQGLSHLRRTGRDG